MEKYSNSGAIKEKQSSSETENKKPSEEAKKALFHALGFEVEIIANPETAPKVVDFARLWKQIGLADKGIIFPRNHEIYVGINFKKRKKIFEVAEVTEGEQFEVTPKDTHFIEIHNEPDDQSLTKPIDELHDNLPNMHYGDMLALLDNDLVYCSIIIRMISDTEAGIVLGIKTDKYNDSHTALYQSSEYLYNLRRKINRTLENDDVLIIKNGLAIYRGFVDLPPKKGKSFLRLRKPD